MNKHEYLIREIPSGNYDVFYKDVHIGHCDWKDEAIDIVIDHACTRAESAEARAVDLQARLNAMHSEYDAAKDEWHASLKRAAQAEAERDKARRQLAEAQQQTAADMIRRDMDCICGHSVDLHGVSGCRAFELVGDTGCNFCRCTLNIHDALIAGSAAIVEREACAKIAESPNMIHGLRNKEVSYSSRTAHDIAAAIRARSNDPH